MNWAIRQAIDLAKGYPDTVVWPNALMIPGDGNAHVWEVEIKNDGHPADLTGYSASAYFQRDDAQSNSGKATAVYIVGTVSGNKVLITLETQCYAVSGTLRGVLHLSKGAAVLSVCETFFTVRPKLPDRIVDPGDTIPSLEELVLSESTRQSNEGERQSNESMRQTQETTRQSQESTRKSNEGERASAESTRTQAERQRQQDASQAVSNANAAARGANTMAARAGTAAQSIEGLTIAATKVAAGGQPTATVAMVDGHMHVTVGVVTGDKGEQGKQFVILGGAYATPEALQAGVKAPGVGDQYNVGAAAPYSIYRWTGKAWENQGRLQGAPGINGTNGTNGKDGAPGINGTNGKDGAPGINGTNGKDGAPGKDGTNASAQVFVAELLAGGWSVSAPYTQSVNVAGVTPAMLPFADVVTAQSAATAQAELEAWGLIGKITTGSGTITATCYEEKPAVTLTVRMQAIA